jgi:cytochrome c oxidase subunit 1
VVTGAILLGAIFTPWAVLYGAAPLFVVLVGWFWPKRNRSDRVEEPLAPGDPTPVVPEARA